jgi:diguanylate cyclase (GGDEF)-like protein
LPAETDGVAKLAKRLFSGYLLAGGLEPILWPVSHGLALRTERAALILVRVSVIATMFAVLTPAWVVLDVFSFDAPVWQMLAMGRAAAGGLFAFIAWQAAHSSGTAAAYRGLFALFGTPVAFYLFSEFVALEDVNVANTAVAAHIAYADLPFVIAAGLSVFPLAAVESAALALPLVSATLWIAVRHPYGLQSFGIETLFVTGIAAVAGMTQLRFMAAHVEKSTRDGLTGLFSRGFGEQVLALQFAIAARAGAPLSVIFLDLDRFKEVNDRYGHAAGDAVLRGAAQAVLKILRSQDIGVRWGGEEFLIVLPNTDADGAAAMVARLAAGGFAARPGGSPQTVSVGIAERGRDGVPDWGRLARLADERMYQAKQAGRNRVVDCGGAARVLSGAQ